MGNIKDITGQTFGRLTVIRQAGFNLQRQALWLCKCECGQEFIRVGTKLRNGTSKGCRRHAKRIRPYEWIYNLVVYWAKDRQLDSTLTYKDFLEFIKTDKCHYCYSPIKWEPYTRENVKYRYNLDRTDNNKGYTKENCVVCCLRCNRGKGNLFSYDEWYKMTECFRKNKRAYPLPSTPFLCVGESLTLGPELLQPLRSPAFG